MSRSNRNVNEGQCSHSTWPFSQFAVSHLAVSLVVFFPVYVFYILMGLTVEWTDGFPSFRKCFILYKTQLCSEGILIVTNTYEGFHSQLNAAFGRRHPTVFKVIEVVKDIALWVLGHLGERKLDFTWEVKIYWQ